MPRLNEAQRNNAIDWWEAGETQTEVASTFYVSQSTISRILDRYGQHRSTRDLPRSGRPRMTTAAQDCYIRVRHLRDRFTTATSTVSSIPGRHRISDQTVWPSTKGWDKSKTSCSWCQFEPTASSKQTPMGSDALSMEVDRFGGRSVMMGPAISHSGKTNLVINSDLTARRYCDESFQLCRITTKPSNRRTQDCIRLE